MRRISRILLHFGLCGLLLTACSSGGPVKARRAAEAPTRHVLHNGVRVLIQDYPSSEVVAVQLWVRAGGRDEAATELGLAHYLEHMLFKGTTTRAKGFVDRDVEAVGGQDERRQLRATSPTTTWCCRRRARSRPIEMLADISVNSSLDETELELEKKVVIEEMRLSEDTPQRHLVRQLYGMVFDGHPYGRSVLGTPEIIQSLTRHDLALVLPPPLRARVLHPRGRWAGEHAGDAPGGRAHLRSPAEERLPPATAIRRPRRSRRRRMRCGGRARWPTSGWGGSARSSTTPTHRRSTCSSRSSVNRARRACSNRSASSRHSSIPLHPSYAALEAGGVITVTAQLESENLARAEAEILSQIRRIREQGVTDEELRRAITRAEADHAFRSETAEGRARLLGHAETVWRLAEELAYVDRLRSVKLGSDPPRRSALSGS